MVWFKICVLLGPKTLVLLDLLVPHWFSNMSHFKPFGKANILVTQKAAVVHILLDIASQNPPSQNESKNLQEIQCLICCFIHEMFIEEEALCKLIHFQGYSLQGFGFKFSRFIYSQDDRLISSHLGSTLFCNQPSVKVIISYNFLSFRCFSQNCVGLTSISIEFYKFRINAHRLKFKKPQYGHI